MSMNVDSQWLFTLDDFEHTPSAEDGWTVQQQFDERAKAVDFMFRVGMTLLLPMTPLATAATYIHRFFMRRAHQDYGYRELAVACLFLAAKIEEHARKVVETARAAVIKSNQHLQNVDSTFESGKGRKDLDRWIGHVLKNEEAIVSVLCFDLVVEHAHTVLADMCEQWRADNPRQSNADQLDRLEAAAQTIANDALRTPLCVLAPPNIVAFTCFVIAAQDAKISLLDEFLAQPEGNSDANQTVSVFQLFDLPPENIQLVHICLRVIRDLYASQTEYTGRHAYLDVLAKLPVPAEQPPLFHCEGGDDASQSEHEDDTDNGGSQTPRTDGSKTPGGFGTFSQQTAASDASD